MPLNLESGYLEGWKTWIESIIPAALHSPAKTLTIVVMIVFALKRILKPSPYRNISGPASSSFMYGHIQDMLGPDGASFQDHLQSTYGSLSKIKGSFGEDRLYISDPRAMQEILVKEHDKVFQHPQVHYEIMTAMFGPGLLASRGTVHKAQRKMLNPVFSAKHMKILEFVVMSRFHVLAQEMKDCLVKELGDSGSKEINAMYWCNAVALELIGQAGLGHKFGVFQGVKSAYSVAIKDFLPALSQTAPYRPIFSLVYKLPSAVLRRKIAEYAPMPSIQRMNRVVKIQDEQAQAILSQKKSDFETNLNTGESDNILSIILKANSQSSGYDSLPEDQILARSYLLATRQQGISHPPVEYQLYLNKPNLPPSGAIARTLHLLSQNPEIQGRLRAELRSSSPDADYEEIHALPFMDAICREVLRLHPPAPNIERRTLSDWTIPLRYPVKGKDGSERNEIKVKKGTLIYLGIRGANRCKETWGEDADIFRPGRWLEELPQSVVDARTPGVYSSSMTFSAGPRACIGFKFSLLELKIVLSTLIRSFEFTPSEKEVEWKVAGTMAPFAVDSKETTTVSQLPLRVTVLN
ncbi:cytochrome P450 family protein [Ceratobasidium sp. AG-Ba]|nr:cytochrome P450 family protein [Ceratobasidium sp. AG-Ba]